MTGCICITEEGVVSTRVFLEFAVLVYEQIIVTS